MARAARRCLPELCWRRLDRAVGSAGVSRAPCRAAGDVPTASPYLLLADTLGGIRTTGMMSCNPAIADGSIHEFLCVIPRMME